MLIISKLKLWHYSGTAFTKQLNNDAQKIDVFFHFFNSNGKYTRGSEHLELSPMYFLFT